MTSAVSPFSTGLMEELELTSHALTHFHVLIGMNIESGPDSSKSPA